MLVRALSVHAQHLLFGYSCVFKCTLRGSELGHIQWHRPISNRRPLQGNALHCEYVALCVCVCVSFSDTVINTELLSPSRHPATWLPEDLILGHTRCKCFGLVT